MKSVKGVKHMKRRRHSGPAHLVLTLESGAGVAPLLRVLHTLHALHV